MSVTRRNALALTGAGITAALANVAAHASAPAAKTSRLADAIAAHKAAREAFNVAIDEREEAEHQHWETHKRDVIVPLSIGGGQELCLRFDLDLYAGDVRKAIEARYHDAICRMRPVEKLNPALAAESKTLLEKGRATDLRELERIVREEHAYRATTEMGAKCAANEVANEAEERALVAVCACPCATAQEQAEKAAYLTQFMGEFDDEHILALITGKTGDEA
jgi:hypothetical protein